MSFPLGAAAAENPSAVIFQAFQEEMDRSLKSLKTDNFPAPYFINYQIRHHHHIEVSGSFGALLNSLGTEKRTLFVDVRVGNPGFDSSTPGSHRHNVKQFIPLDNDLKSLKRAIWYETDLRYKQAVMNLLRKKGRKFSGVEQYGLPNLSKGNPPVKRIEKIPPMSADISKWQNLVRTVSGRFNNSPEIEKSNVRIILDRAVRYYMDSEKNEVQDIYQVYKILIEAWTKSDSGVQIHDEESFYFSNPERFPSRDEMIQKADGLIQEIIALKKAPKMEPYVGPAIFSPEAAAILFHEAVGHRLEGDRLRHVNDGKTFIQKLGKRILPPFITVMDNPRLKNLNGQDLLGYYLIDDQGQPSEEVRLIEQGVLKNFLLSRSPILKFKKSNGHGRSDGIKFPIARMGNLIVTSEKRLSLPALNQKLIEEVKKRNKPYGLIIKEMISGETQTDKRDFQVFKGKPLFLYKVYPDGREELARGVEFVGTPLSMISHIIATGDDTQVTNGFCIAESGALPVSSITPSILLSEVELQTSHGLNLRKPILPPPR